MKKLLFVILASLSVIKTASCDQSLTKDIIATVHQSLNDQKTKDEVSKALRDYRVTGTAFCIDPNFAFLYDNQNPSMVMTFVNSKGEIKTRAYRASINSIGLKFEAAVKLNLVMFVNTNLNFEDSTKELYLGTGIDLSLSLGLGFALTYAPFTNATGGLLILSIPFGLWSVNPLSIVINGSLKPILP